MAPKGGKKGKKEPRSNGKRGAKPARGGKGGRGGSKAGGRMGRRLSFESGQKKNKMSGMRKGDLAGKDLRFVPVAFVKAIDDFELTLETKPNDEDDEELEPVQAPTGVPLDAETSDEDSNTEELDEASVAPSAHTSRGVSTDASVAASGADSVPESPEVSSGVSTEVSTEVSPEISADASADVSVVGTPEPSALQGACEGAQVDSDSDAGLIDATLEAQFNGTDEADIYIPLGGRRSAPAVSFDESVSRLALDSSSSDSDNQSPFEYDQYTASQVDESIFESLSDPEPEFEGMTHDDYDYSDMRAGLHSENEDDDDEDHMEDLDDDQIFALASMATRRVSEHDEFDDSGFDKYDEFDEYFDQLLDRSTEVPPSTKQRVSEGRRLKREARQLLHSMDFGKTPVLWRKYPEEIGVREVLEEIRIFAGQREFQSLSFPPLDNNANWYVKQFAKEHGLRPSIEGHNAQKHVICHLTGRATSHGGKGVNKLLNRRKFFRRVDKVSVGGKVKPRTPGAKVRDGYIVGQHASEITNENFGHRLMRQMGWSEGSGLGKERAGIIAPIPATVKLTKTGLGA